jgi:Tol biopolymer transport system component
MIEVCHGLHSIHSAGVVHRDLKAANIMLALRNAGISAVLLDFGIACTFDRYALPSGTELNRTVGILGTPDYMAPEQFEGKPATPATDLYALGVILYEMTTGSSPFAASTPVGAAVARGRPFPRASSLVSGIPSRCDAIIAKCLEYESSKRFQSVDELLEALERRVPLPIIANRRRLSYSFYWGVAAAVLLALTALISYWLMRQRTVPKGTQYTQLTYDGLPKVVGGTDGSRLYIFGGHGFSFPGGRDVRLGAVAEMSVGGGEIKALPSLPAHMYPSALSPNGLEVLLVEGQGLPHRGPLWSMPVLGGSLRRLADTQGQDAAWSPDGNMIAYGDGNDLMVAKADGTEPRRVTRISDFEYMVKPVWSPDQTHLRFTRLNGSSSIWEVSVDGKDLHRLLPGGQNWNDCCGHWTADGKYFIFQAQKQIWALPRKGAVRGLAAKPAQLTFSPMSLFDPIPSKDGKKLFCVASTARGELLRYDMKAGRFTPYLGGISAEYAAFSKDGHWVAYVSYPEGTLWRSKVDGSERLQLTFPSSNPVLPRWSPDGKTIVFFQVAPDLTTRLFTISREGGSPQPLLPGGPQPQRSPTWSTDGSKIAFGGNGRDPQAVIRILDVASSKVTTVPGSQGLYSPRWSPDGRFLAALSSNQRRLLLFEFQTQRWTELANGTLNWPCWSHDSHSLYLLDGNQAGAVIRIRLSDRKLKRVVDLSNLVTTGYLAGALALTPDDSPLLLRDAGTYDVYALDLNGP